MWRGRSKTWCTCRDRKSTRLNSSHANISYAVFCLKKKSTGHIDERLEVLRSVLAAVGLKMAKTPVRALLGLVARRAFFFNDASPTEIYTLSLHDALPIYMVHLS